MQRWQLQKAKEIDVVLSECKRELDTIKLTRTAQGWVAEYSGPHSQNVQRLFGTTIIPTPFTSVALPELVRAAIQTLNADVEVSL